MDIAHLTVRQSDFGPQLRPVQVRNRAGLYRDRLWVVFVHGATVDRPRAQDQAATLFKSCKLDDLATPVLFSWPATSGRQRMRSRVDYPAFVDKARRSGALLGRYLAVHKRSRVIVVGQSLGALVVLEAADTFLTIVGEQLPTLVLTGAAVETDEVKEGGRLDDVVGRREIVLYSRSDLVLRLAFEIGQRRTHARQRTSEAVGLRGMPEQRWRPNGRPPSSQRVNSRVIDHAYWRQPVARTAIEAAQFRRTVPPVPRLSRWHVRRWLSDEV
jgi:pimeloyl-ACP methyl ester carboxylesterase